MASALSLYRGFGITRIGTRDGRVINFGARTGNTVDTLGCSPLDVVIRQIGKDLDLADDLKLQGKTSYQVALDWYNRNTSISTRAYVFLPLGNECDTWTTEGKRYRDALEADIAAASASAAAEAGSHTIQPDYQKPTGAGAGEPPPILSGLWWKAGLVLAGIGALVYAPQIKMLLGLAARRRK